MPTMTPPRAEHPNPIFTRADWQTLNGEWEFCFDPANEGEQRRWWSGRVHAVRGAQPREPFGRTIVVPFPWESRLSGIGEPDYLGVAWYRRQVVVPREWLARGLRPVLHFAAVDWEARVWVNGHLAAEHVGGYTPFTVDLGPHLRGEEPLSVVVRVRDDCEAATLLGKQTVHWYTHSSGIWQSVWLEGRPDSYVASVALTSELAAGRMLARVGLDVAVAGSYVLQARSPDGQFADQERVLSLAPGHHTVSLDVAIPNPRPWSPDDPYLYRFDVELRDSAGEPDLIHTYAGLREISTGCWDGRDYEYVLLNGEPVYLRGALDQAFHPDGVHTYPSDDAIRGDIQGAKDAGLNCLRCHIKINDPRYYYWADRLGLLILQDIPSPAIDTPASRRAWQHCLRSTIDRDVNHPSIVAWILFNETWGLTEHGTPASWQWLAEQVAMAKALDPTRLIEDNSPCNYDHVVTELNSWHFYLTNWSSARRHVQEVVDRTHPGSTFNYVAGLSKLPEAARYVQGRQPLLNSEYAGVSAGMGDRDVSQSLKFLTTDLRRHDKICGYVYTELTDIEWEHNGLLEYDRSPKEFGYDGFVSGMTTADLLGDDVIGFDCPPCRTLEPGAEFRATAFVSHWSTRDLRGSSLRWRINAIDRCGERYVWRDGAVSVEPRRYAVTEAGAIAAPLPKEPGLLTFSLRLVDATGKVVARNYVNVEVWSAPSPRCERMPSGWALRVAPGEYQSTTWLSPRVIAEGGKVAASGSGSVAYRFPLPPDMQPAAINGLRLKLELGTRAAGNRADSWGRRQSTDYPQTEPGRRTPGDVAIHLSGHMLERRRLADDPNDARGILTFHQGAGDDSSYGELVEIAVSADVVGPIVQEAQRDGAFVLRLEVPSGGGLARGLSIYGERMGAYPLDLTLMLDMEAGPRPALSPADQEAREA